MTMLKLPVPPGFVITTKACIYVSSHNGEHPVGLDDEINVALAELERKTNGKKLGDANQPLLLSCRSGAKISMPGMMDTVLNIGLTDITAQSLIKLTNARFVWDAYRRLIAGFGSICMGIEDKFFEDKLNEYKKQKSYKNDVELDENDWIEIVKSFKEIYRQQANEEFPQDPKIQLFRSINAVFNSWNSKRAIAYRKASNIPNDLGTACNIMQMVFGNMGNDSATGVAFTRDPATGNKSLYGDYLTNAQGEDVVAGIRNTVKVSEMNKEFPQCAKELDRICVILENYFKNMQDIEFTIESSKLYMLQCRDGKRAATAAVKIAVDMVGEGLLTKEEAVNRIQASDVDVLLHPQFDPNALSEAKAAKKWIGKGVNASPGAGVGQLVFDPSTAEQLKKNGKKVIMCRQFTKSDDVSGFFSSQAVLTAEGGATSHAAVVARQFGIPCVVGAKMLIINYETKTLTIDGRPDLILREGDVISVDGTNGDVYAGSITTSSPEYDEQVNLKTLLSWCDEITSSPTCRVDKPNGCKSTGLQVFANADSKSDALRAVKFGAKGIGLCRTEHMFYDTKRLAIMVKMILSSDEKSQKECLDELLLMQQSDFSDLFEVMNGNAVIIRLIDPPLHEFLPHLEDLMVEVTKLELSTKEEDKLILVEKKKLLSKVQALHESNPMLGLRGVRLSIINPQIVEMQVRAIIQAALFVQEEKKINVMPEIMIPLTSDRAELDYIRPQLDTIVKKVFEEQKKTCPYKMGTMVETPRACLTASELSKTAEFFSFGSNDLTQATFAISRDDAERTFLLEYISKGVFAKNPFQELDEFGVGKLINMAVSEARKTNSNSNSHFEIGICGEHGGNPNSIKLAHKYGLDYVSCSPFRVVIARLATAQAAIAYKNAAATATKTKTTTTTTGK